MMLYIMYSKKSNSCPSRTLTPIITNGTISHLNDLLTFCRGQVHKRVEGGAAGEENNLLLSDFVLLRSRFPKLDGKPTRKIKLLWSQSMPAYVSRGHVKVTDLHKDDAEHNV